MSHLIKNMDKKLVEDAIQKVPVSQSELWNCQQEFYKKQGIAAWDEKKIPYYVTCNPYIANAYANIIHSYIKDNIELGYVKPDTTFYILELGAGSGVFSFYLMKRLFELKTIFSESDVSFGYIMTDCIEKNIEFWRTHPAFGDYINRGFLDFAVYDLNKDQEIKLVNSGDVFSSNTHNNDSSFVVVANYVFDSLPQDIFRTKNGRLQQGLMNKKIEMKKYGDNQSMYIDEFDKSFSFQDIFLPYYHEKEFDDILKSWAKQFENGYLTFPIGSLRAIQRLAKIMNNDLLLIATDKAYANHFELYATTKPDITFHGSAFSMTVDFHSIGQYFMQHNGDRYHQCTQQGITTSAFILGKKIETLPETNQALMTYLDTFGPGDLFNMYRYIYQKLSFVPLEVLISCLNMMHWDPQLFNDAIESIIRQLKSANPVTIQDLLVNLPRVHANFYFMPHSDDTLVNIGMIFQEIEAYDSALFYYQASLDYFGENETTLYNMALCHFFMGNYDKAIDLFQSATKLNPEYIMAKGWIEHIKETTGFNIEIKENV